MAGKDLKEAAEKLARKKEILKQPVYKLADDPENLHISKAEFLAKRRNKKEEDLAVESFRKDFRTKKAVEPEVEEEVMEEVVEPKKKKHSKKIEE